MLDIILSDDAERAAENVEDHFESKNEQIHRIQDF